MVQKFAKKQNRLNLPKLGTRPIEGRVVLWRQHWETMGNYSKCGVNYPNDMRWPHNIYTVYAYVMFLFSISYVIILHQLGCTNLPEY